MIGSSGCVCFDETRPKGDQDYTLTFEKCINYRAFSPDMAQAIEAWGGKKCSSK